VTRTGGGLNDALSFTWSTTGTKSITVTASNAGGQAESTRLVTITAASGRTVYLPLVIRDR
jgi:PKD repeat protein